MSDEIDRKIIRERIEDLRVFKRGHKSGWFFLHESQLTKSSLGVIHKHMNKTIIRVIFSNNKNMYTVVSNSKGMPIFAFRDAPTHEDVINIVDELIAQSEKSNT